MFINRRNNSNVQITLLVTSCCVRASAILVILFIFGCGEETVDNPLGGGADGSRETQDPESISPIYYPMTLGSRWVYRNPDGAEWSTEVTEIEEVGSHVYHFFGYGPRMGDDQSDFAGTSVNTSTPYVKTLDGRLTYGIEMSDLNDAVRRTISQSGRVPPSRWGIKVKCDTGVKDDVCRMEKKETIYRDGEAHRETNNDALICLFWYDARVVWNSELTMLRFPLVPYRQWKVIDVRMSGTWYEPPFWDVDGVGDLHSFEADVTISGIAGQPESVVTPAGAFANCLKIQYKMTRLFLKTTEFTVSRPVFEQKLLDLYENELSKELTTLFRDALPRMQLGAVWLAPGVGPVRIERADGISELISYDVKTGSGLRHVASEKNSD
ncbi:MAG: hypothetical protein OXN17_13415 [Candidatus Poribacteria bacterium]|nr:hypothetical protein [Candidatus Poribacteria bacterium]